LIASLVSIALDLVCLGRSFVTLALIAIPVVCPLSVVLVTVASFAKLALPPRLSSVAMLLIIARLAVKT
jgi:hypothetical protein